MHWPDSYECTVNSPLIPVLYVWQLLQLRGESEMQYVEEKKTKMAQPRQKKNKK